MQQLGEDPKHGEDHGARNRQGAKAGDRSADEKDDTAEMALGVGRELDLVRARRGEVEMQGPVLFATAPIIEDAAAAARAGAARAPFGDSRTGLWETSHSKPPAFDLSTGSSAPAALIR